MIPEMLRGLRRDHYACIATDCGTRFDARSSRGITDRSPESKYLTMDDEHLAALPVGRYASDDCHLFYWDTGPRVAVGRHIPIMRAWGFEPVSMWGVWLKPTKKAFEHGQLFLDDELLAMRMGFTSRQNAEFVILGRRGSPKRISKAVRQCFFEPSTVHSAKPEKFYANVERYCVGPRLELFGRRRRLGWTVRGNQVGMFE